MHLAAWLCSRVKFICRDRGGLPGGLLLVLADCRPVRGEPVRGGAANGCYGKLTPHDWFGRQKFVHCSHPLMYCRNL